MNYKCFSQSFARLSLALFILVPATSFAKSGEAGEFQIHLRKVHHHSYQTTALLEPRIRLVPISRKMAKKSFTSKSRHQEAQVSVNELERI